MNILSGLLRLLAGSAVLAMAGWVWSTNHARLIERGGQGTLDLFGQEIPLTSDTLLVAVGLAGALGLLLVILGLITCFRRPVPAVQPPA
ncbi:MAG: hypothetical protein H0X38_09045 [Planctomycetes bacterium]|nr:hypothetical protein [Planctomycetota bacterium]